MIWYIIGGIFLILVGLALFLDPEFIWELTESWKCGCMAEPSDLYIIQTKVGGVVFILVGIVGIAAPFLPIW
jgi:hypothetical protein